MPHCSVPLTFGTREYADGACHGSCEPLLYPCPPEFADMAQGAAPEKGSNMVYKH
jgi:hypothetical protein